MSDLERFCVFIAAAFLLFLSVVLWVVRKRPAKPSRAVLLALATVVVPVGMMFARYSHIVFPNLPWEVYYGVPALTTLLFAAVVAANVPLGKRTVCPFGFPNGTGDSPRLLAIRRMARLHALSRLHPFARRDFTASRRDLKHCSLNRGLRGGGLRYVRQNEREQMDKDSGMPGVPGRLPLVERE